MFDAMYCRFSVVPTVFCYFDRMDALELNKKVDQVYWGGFTLGMAVGAVATLAIASIMHWAGWVLCP